jgi:excisionase family DNA binding protein
MTTRVQFAPLLTVDETARRLRVSDKTVRRLIGRGEIRAIRVGGGIRVDPEELEDAVQRWKVGLGSSADTPSSAVGRGSSDRSSAERDGTSKNEASRTRSQLAGEEP